MKNNKKITKMKNFGQKGFYRITIVVLLSIFFVAIMIESYAFNKRYFAEMEDELLNTYFAPTQKIQAQYMASRLENQIKDILNIEKTIAEFSELQEISSTCKPEQEEYLIRSLIAFRGSVDYIGLFDKNAVVICAPSQKSLEGQSLAGYPNIQEALLLKKPVVSRPLINPLGVKMISLIVPVFSKTGEFAGLLSVAINLDSFERQLISELKLTESAYAFLIDDDGTIIHHPNQSVEMTNIFGAENQELIGSDKDLNNIYRKMLLRESDYDFYDFKGLSKIVGFAPVNLINGDRFWVVGMTAGVDDYKYVTKLFSGKILLVDLVIVFFGFVVVTLLAIFLRNKNK